jgi:ATP/maltotriose-dependent transcriptional regulator MalT
LLARAAEELAPADIERLQRKAAESLSEAGENEAALELFLSVGDHARAAALITGEAPNLLVQGRARTISGWVSRLSIDAFASNPWLSFFAGAAKLGSDPSSATRLIADAFAAFEAQEEPVGYWLAWCALVRAHLLEANDFRPLPALVARAEAARERLPFTPLKVE